MSSQDCKFCSFERMIEMGIIRCNREAFQVYCGYTQAHKKQLSKAEFDSKYHGKFRYVEDFCEQLYAIYDESYGNLHETLKNNIDWSDVWKYTIEPNCIFEQGYIFSKN